MPTFAFIFEQNKKHTHNFFSKNVRRQIREWLTASFSKLYTFSVCNHSTVANATDDFCGLTGYVSPYKYLGKVVSSKLAK